MPPRAPDQPENVHTSTVPAEFLLAQPHGGGDDVAPCQAHETPSAQLLAKVAQKPSRRAKMPLRQKERT
jgi:hypothetical protein